MGIPHRVSEVPIDPFLKACILFESSDFYFCCCCGVFLRPAAGSRQRLRMPTGKGQRQARAEVVVAVQVAVAEEAAS